MDSDVDILRDALRRIYTLRPIGDIAAAKNANAILMRAGAIAGEALYRTRPVMPRPPAPNERIG